ncbi:Low-density lipoprotein receptor-related protein 6 [Geodia barretti]|uniref:Low-density lipoprotein receptor-related protein 6 n=1 Tax=Geodia barretti TaxID=519541 RepID=A0AA35S1C9_GEOBA|nr:Low-density lipoprotein receptor-related protein 6 [Geodia barretti]
MDTCTMPTVLTSRGLTQTVKNKVDKIQAPSNVTGLAVDASLNRLYWTSNGEIRFIDLSLDDPLPQTIGTSSVPYGLSASDGTLYWTVLGNNVTSLPGAIYMLVVNGDDDTSPTVLHESMDIHPRDVSISSEITSLDEGCGNDNGGCDQLCFSVPSSTGQGTMPECGCSTGIQEDPVSNLCPRVPTNFLLFGRTITDTLSRISMVSLDTDRDVSVLLPFQIPGYGANYISYDITTLSVYWDEMSPPAIKRSEIDSGEVDTFISTDIRRVSGLAVDPFSRNLYWSDSALDRIEVVSLSSNDRDGRRARRVLVSGDIHTPQSLSLDLMNGYMYWVDRESGEPRIERARLDGSERQVFHRGTSHAPTFIVVNPASDDVFWSDDEDGDINTVDSNTERGFPVGAISVHGLAIVDNELYWTDGFDGKIGVATIREEEGEGPEVRRGVTFFENIDGVKGIVAVDTDHFIDNDNLCALSHGCSHICLFNSSAVCQCPDGLQFQSDSHQICTEPDGYAVIALADKTGETTTTYLELYTRSLNILTEMWAPESSCPGGMCTETVDIVSMAIHLRDDAAIDVYYVQRTDKLIYRRSITIGNPESDIGEATPIITCCLATPKDLAVDWLGRNLYWTDSLRGVIEVSLLSGRSRRVLYSELDQPSLLVLDPRRGDLFFTQGDTKIIYRRKMDGTSETSVSICNSVRNCTLHGYPTIVRIVSLSIDFDPSPMFRDKLVWSYWSGTETVTVGYDLGGADSDPHLIRLISPPAISSSLYFNQSLYYSKENSEKIDKWFDNGGTHDVFSLTGIEGSEFTFLDFSIVHPRTQPGYHECTAGEFCTGHHPLCLVQDHIYGSCICPLDSFKTVHVDTLLGQRTEVCTQANSFVILATKTDIYYYPLPSDLTDAEVTSEPRIVPRGNHSDVVAVTYDPYSQSIIWLEKGTNLLYSVTVEGLESRVLGRFPDRVSLRSMSLDWIGGQVIFTETTGYQVSSASVRGEGENLTVGSVVSAYLVDGDVVFPSQPRGVLFDETSRSIIWHEEGRQIFKSALGTPRDSLSPLLAESSDRTIEYLTFDPSIGYVYWWNRDAKKIEGEAAILYCNVTRKLDDGDFECRQKYLSWSPGNLKNALLAMMSFDVSRYNAIDTVSCAQFHTSCGGSLECFPNTYACDGVQHCTNGFDETNCVTTTPPTSTTKDPSTSGSANYVTIITVTTIFVMLAFFVFVIFCVSVRCIARQKRRRQRFHFPPTSKAGSSPPPRSDSSSIYSGMSSLGTESTNFNCGSPHPDPFEKRAVFHPERSTHISNPPPSLITAARRQSQLLEGEEESQADPCPPPCPSVDWENMSALSYSASQGGMRLTTMNGGGQGAENYYNRPPGFRGHHHPHHPQAENPLHYHGGFRGNTHVYHHHHGNGRPYGVPGGSSAGTSYVSHSVPHPRRSVGDSHHYPPISMSRLRGNARGVYPSDLPNYEEAETETVFSQSTIQTENGSNFPFDDRTPPGRPPSPATITEYSERDLQQRVPLSPASEYDEEEEEEGEGEGGGGGGVTVEDQPLHLHEDQV